MSFFNNKYIQFSMYRDADLEAFYDIDPKYRRSIIFAHMMIHFLPVIVAVLLFREFLGVTYTLQVSIASILFYSGVILETTAYMYPRSRKLFKRIFPWLFIPFTLIGGYGGYVVGTEFFSLGSLQQFGTYSATLAVGFGVFIWTYIGMSLVLKASRAIYTKKASIEADVRFATEVQKRILKDVTIQHHSSKAYAISIPANELGGDYFELSRHEDTIFASVGDVSGHSFGAGLLMTMTKSALQTHLEYNRDPSGIIKSLNRMFLKQSDRRMFATMAMLKLNLSTKKAYLCNAGHHPVLHFVAETGELEDRQIEGIVLGVRDKAEYANLEFSVAKGDVLFLYSDGLIETRDQYLNIRDADFFEQMIKQAVSGPAVDPEELSKGIMAEIEQSDYADRFEDDATLIAIKV